MNLNNRFKKAEKAGEDLINVIGELKSKLKSFTNNEIDLEDFDSLNINLEKFKAKYSEKVKPRKMK